MMPSPGQDRTQGKAELRQTDEEQPIAHTAFPAALTNIFCSSSEKFNFEVLTARATILRVNLASTWKTSRISANTRILEEQCRTALDGPGPDPLDPLGEQTERHVGVQNVGRDLPRGLDQKPFVARRVDLEPFQHPCGRLQRFGAAIELGLDRAQLGVEVGVVGFLGQAFLKLVGLLHCKLDARGEVLGALG